jgi:hypothetical protein
MSELQRDPFLTKWMVQRGSLQILLRIRSREAALFVRSTIVVQVGR